MIIIIVYTKVVVCMHVCVVRVCCVLVVCRV